MNDITEGLDLLGDFLDAKGYTEEAGLCTRSMDEINRLREALKPFADLADKIEAANDDDDYHFPAAKISDLRAARVAIGESDE